MISDERRAGRKRMGQVGEAFLGKVVQRIRDLDVAEMSPSDVAQWTTVALKLQQVGTVRESTPERREEYLARVMPRTHCPCGAEVDEDDRCCEGDDDD